MICKGKIKEKIELGDRIKLKIQAVDGLHTYSDWDKKSKDILPESDVDFDFYKKDNPMSPDAPYRNINTIKISVEKNDFILGSQVSEPKIDIQKLIIRQSCIKSACILLAGLNLDLETTVVEEKTIKLARIFEGYVYE